MVRVFRRTETMRKSIEEQRDITITLDILNNEIISSLSVSLFPLVMEAKSANLTRSEVGTGPVWVHRENGISVPIPGFVIGRWVDTKIFQKVIKPGYFDSEGKSVAGRWVLRLARTVQK
jgi:hypothetical protein